VQIPHTVLAGILVKVGLDIIDFKYINPAFRGPRCDFVLMMLVLLMTVFVNLIIAVGVGVFFAALGYVKRVGDDQIKAVGESIPERATEEELELIEGSNGAVTEFDFGSPLSFGATADLGHHARQRMTAGLTAIVLDFSSMTFIDVSAANAIETIAMDAEDTGKLVYASGINDTVKSKLIGLDVYKSLVEGHVFTNRTDALKAAIAAIGVNVEQE